mmetsp:Transcript_8945/g.23401  ORF Transcript_8945/g.23401 Transcript_8945/m.23401 type:complete len:660 (+) Transcript_8945:53-2032(+)
MPQKVRTSSGVSHPASTKSKANPKASAENLSLQGAAKGPLANVACFLAMNHSALASAKASISTLGGKTVTVVKEATHVILDDTGTLEIYQEARGLGIFTVSAMWLEMCKSANTRMEERFASACEPPPIVSRVADALPGVAGAEKDVDDDAGVDEDEKEEDEEAPEQAVVTEEDDDEEEEAEVEAGEAEQLIDDEAEREIVGGTPADVAAMKRGARSRNRRASIAADTPAAAPASCTSRPSRSASRTPAVDASNAAEQSAANAKDAPRSRRASTAAASSVSSGEELNTRAGKSAEDHARKRGRGNRLEMQDGSSAALIAAEDVAQGRAASKRGRRRSKTGTSRSEAEADEAEEADAEAEDEEAEEARAPSRGKRAKKMKHAADVEMMADEAIDWETRHALAPSSVALSLSHDVPLRETIGGAIRGLGGCPYRPADDTCVHARTSHLIVDDELPPKRTLKLIHAIARGLPIVKSSWVLSSVTAGKWLDWRAYEAVPCHPHATQQLEGASFHIGSPGSISRSELESIITLAGGRIVPLRAATHAVNLTAPWAKTVSLNWIFTQICDPDSDGSSSAPAAAPVVAGPSDKKRPSAKGSASVPPNAKPHKAAASKPKGTGTAAAAATKKATPAQAALAALAPSEAPLEPPVDGPDDGDDSDSSEF